MSSAAFPAVIDVRPFQTHIDDYISPNNDGDLNGIDLPIKEIDDANDKEWLLELKILPEDMIVLADPHCPLCHRRLWKNGINQKVAYPDGFENRKEFTLQRYTCPDCGEIRIDYSHIFDNISKYGKETEKMVKNAFGVGTPPNRIQLLAIIF